MPTLRDQLLSLVSGLRQIPADLGFRRYGLTVRVSTWSGAEPGLGIATNSDVTISPKPDVRFVSVKEIAASGGTYQEGDFFVSKITPYFAGPPAGGYTPAQLRPAVSADNQDVVYVLTGDEGAIECALIEEHLGKPRGSALRYALVLRRRTRG